MTATVLRRLLHTAALLLVWLLMALFFGIVGACGASIGTARSILDVWGSGK